MEIKTILTKELELLKQLLNILKKETDALKRGALKEIQHFLNEKKELTIALDELESVRFQKMGLLTFAQYMNQTDEDYRELFQQYKEVVEAIQSCNEVNKMLIQMGYNTSTEFLKILTKPVKENVQTYGHTGSMTQQSVIKSKLLNRQA